MTTKWEVPGTGVTVQSSIDDHKDERSFAEAYTMRSKFFHDLGESAKKLADTYVYDTDLENRAAFKELVWDAVMHSLVEHHGFKVEEL